LVTRRGFLTGTTAAAALAAVGGVGVGAAGASALANSNLDSFAAKRSIDFFGKNQMGIDHPLQAVTNFVAFDIKPEVTREAMLRWLKLLTDDIARLSSGEPVLADPTPQLMVGPARFSAYVGFGYSLFEKLSLQSQLPEGFAPLPAFKVDKLEERFSGGDVLIHIASDDPVVLAHGTRSLVRDSMPFASVRWVQSGFGHSPGVVPAGVTHRNLMGQVDGTANPALGSQDFSDVVWIDSGPDWIQGGTLLVFRRIAMDLDGWDQLGTPAKEEVIGRRLDNGAPLTGTREEDLPDLAARYPNGLKVIPDFAHIRRAAPVEGERIFRRPFSYSAGLAANGAPDIGLLWTAYQKDIGKQFVPIQQRLDELDLLNRWTTPIGSGVYAIPGGVSVGETIGQRLFS